MKQPALRCALVLAHILGIFGVYTSAAQSNLRLVRAFPYLAFDRPVFLTHAGDGTDRIFVAEQDGVIYVFPNDSMVVRDDRRVFLDLAPVLTRFHNEAGLLGLAFHPRYAENGQFYVYYTRSEPNRSVISRFTVDPLHANQADPTSEQVLLEIPQPFLNHQGGMMQFGPADGYLYISVGDGGDRLGGELYPPDVHLNGQNRHTLLGKILRLDVDNPSGGQYYGIPPDNPYATNTDGWQREIWAYGLRNPWRFSIDGPTNRVWVADVGAKAWEEINLVEPGDNLGWSDLEGADCFREVACDTSGIRMPLLVEPHVGGCNSITGGYTYRGSRRPEIVGSYIYGDYCHGYVRLIRMRDDVIVEHRELIDSELNIASFGVDERGELYIVNHGGTLARFSLSPMSTTADPVGELPATPDLLLEAFPNPFEDQMALRFTVSAPGASELAIYDLLGRTVRTLSSGIRPAGTHAVTWDGTDESAKRVAAGVYLARLRHEGGSETRTILLLR